MECICMHKADIHVHAYVGHVHMHAICCALYCHELKPTHMLGGFYIIAYMESCTCYMPKLLHMHMIGVAASQSYMCYIFMQHWHHVVSGADFHNILCIDSTGHLDAFKKMTYIMGQIYHVHVCFGHVHMHAMCCALYCHVCKLFQLPYNSIHGELYMLYAKVFTHAH